MLTLTYLGNACFEIAAGSGRLLVDPYLSENDETDYDVDTYLDDGPALDALCVTHLAYDHFGDCAELARELSVPVITEPAAGYVLERLGIPDEQIYTIVWGMTATVADLTVRALEAHHISTRPLGDEHVTGLPLSFLISDGEHTVYHLGDTSIFSDLELFGRLYAPDVSLIGVGQARRTPDGPVGKNIAELTTEEAVMVAEWLGSDTVIPMHYLPAERDAFVKAMASTVDAPAVVPLDPGEEFTLT